MVEAVLELLQSGAGLVIVQTTVELLSQAQKRLFEIAFYNSLVGSRW